MRYAAFALVTLLLALGCSKENLPVVPSSADQYVIAADGLPSLFDTPKGESRHADFVVSVLRDGSPARGTAVSVSARVGIVSPARSVTDSLGRVGVGYDVTVPFGTMTDTISIRCADVILQKAIRLTGSAAPFRLTLSPTPDTLYIVRNHTGEENLTATLYDRRDHPLPGFVLTWTITPDGGGEALNESLVPETVTDSTGVSTNPLHLDAGNGQLTIRCAVKVQDSVFAPRQITVAETPDLQAIGDVLFYTGFDSVAVEPDSDYSARFYAQIFDTAGNPVEGILPDVPDKHRTSLQSDRF